jgi:DmsE family decaheme c-type cytochrome
MQPIQSNTISSIQLCWILMLYLCITPQLQAKEMDNTDIQKYMVKEVCMACHKDLYDKMSTNKHWSAHAGQGDNPCLYCHDDAVQHVIHGLGRKSPGLITFGWNSHTDISTQNKTCLNCHTDTGRIHWQNSAHNTEDVSCTQCHFIHQPDKVRESKSEAAICYRCHQIVRGEMLKPYAHPVVAEKLSCSDCHEAHGSPGLIQLKQFTLNETCTSCHADKRGPFLWEHAPVSEDCSLCHKAHGSIHPGMLTKRRPQLCQSCHQPNAEFAARHARRPLSYWEPTLGAPGDHVNRLVLGESCMNCHVQVHGSNHPSGARLMR